MAETVTIVPPHAGLCVIGNGIYYENARIATLDEGALPSSVHNLRALAQALDAADILTAEGLTWAQTNMRELEDEIRELQDRIIELESDLLDYEREAAE